MKNFVCCLQIAFLPSLIAETHHVDHSVATAGDGSSWANAFANLQDALAVASSSDTILVASGTYYPDEGGAASNDDRASSFQLVEGVTIEGGYPNGGGARDLSTQQTILSGDLDKNDNGILSGNNSYSVVTGSGVTSAANLDGVLITGGLADGPSVDAFDGPTRAGAGLFSSGGSPSLINCTFAGNSAGFGGGAFSISSSSPTFTNCLFSGNKASFFGGALNNRNSSSPILINCTLTGNSAGSASGGGAITNFASSNPTLTNCIVWNNEENGNTTTEASSVNNGGSTVTTFNYSLVQNFNPGGMNIDGTNAANSPGFLIPVVPGDAPTLAGDLQLGTGSPALDAGDNSANTETTDLIGASRIQNVTIDLGALEGAFEALLPDILYVDQSNASPGDGASWENAFTTLQDALAAAVIDQQIFVAAGTYHPDQGGGATAGDRNATFQLKTAIEILGGYPSGGGVRDLSANPTILSGDIDGNDSGSPSGGNSYSIVTGSGADTSAILDGFTITGGLADGPNADGFAPSRAGAGLFSSRGRPSLINCTFVGNSAVFGGGAFFISSSTPTLTNCLFSGNKATAFGGALNNRSGSSPILINCTLTGNSAGSANGGGAITNFSASNPTLTNCIVWNNEANGTSTAEASSINNGGSTVTTFDHSLIQNVNPGGTNIDGTDIANSPLFVISVDPATAPTSAGDLRLSSGSAVLDTGLNAANAQPLDLAGNIRIQNTTIDLGALEGEVLVPDSDNDGLSDSFELAHTNPPSSTALAADSNTDLDPFTALEEFAYGLDPTVANAISDALEKRIIDVEGTDYFAIIYQVNPAAIAFVNIISERSTDLGENETWSSTGLVAVPSPFTGARSMLTLGSVEREFLRLRVMKK